MFNIEEIKGIITDGEIEDISKKGILIIPENIDKIIEEINNLSVRVDGFEQGDYFEPFVNGISKSRSGLYICNLNGEIFKAEATIFGDFSDGYAKAWLGENACNQYGFPVFDKYCFVDAQGKIAFEGFRNVKDFSDGVAPVHSINYDYNIGYDLLWQYIDTNGEKLKSPKYRNASRFKDGQAIVTTIDYDYQMIDRDFKVIRNLPTWQAARLANEFDGFYNNYSNPIEIRETKDASGVTINLINKETGISVLVPCYIDRISSQYAINPEGNNTRELLESFIRKLSAKGNFIIKINSHEITPVELITGVRITDELGRTVESYAEVDKEMVRSRKMKEGK